MAVLAAILIPIRSRVANGLLLSSSPYQWVTELFTHHFFTVCQGELSSSTCLQLAFTMVWMTIVSQLGYYKLLYGPQVLLQMNIAYFLPSIPLLGLSSFYDERMDQKFGMLDPGSIVC